MSPAVIIAALLLEAASVRDSGQVNDQPFA
jgi:hypothetical protein